MDRAQEIHLKRGKSKNLRLEQRNAGKMLKIWSKLFFLILQKSKLKKKIILKIVQANKAARNFSRPKKLEIKNSPSTF